MNESVIHFVGRDTDVRISWSLSVAGEMDVQLSVTEQMDPQECSK